MAKPPAPRTDDDETLEEVRVALDILARTRLYVGLTPIESVLYETLGRVEERLLASA